VQIAHQQAHVLAGQLRQAPGEGLSAQQMGEGGGQKSGECSLRRLCKHHAQRRTQDGQQGGGIGRKFHAPGINADWRRPRIDLGQAKRIWRTAWPYAATRGIVRT
jgi:hypothetical protein